MTCELRFNGESYGWEALFRDDGELLISRGGFVTKVEAIAWARDEYTAQHTPMEVGRG